MFQNPSSHRWRTAMISLSGILLLGACGGDDAGTASSAGEDAGGGAEVVIEDFTFMPENLEVAAGTEVTWTNKDSAAHSVEDVGGLFPESEEIPEGGEFSFTYETPGEYPYICGIHPYMTASVTVT